MKRPEVSIALFASLLVLAGLCPAAAVQPAAEAGPGAGCAGSPWIGVKPAHRPTCPEGGEWQARSLFAKVLASMPEELRKQAERLGLDDFCVYEPPVAEYLAEGMAQSSRPPTGLFQQLKQLRPDCPVLAGAGGTSVPADWPRLESRFLEQAGWIPLPESGRRRVWLTFLDTQPTEEGAPRRPGLSMHGYTLAHLADRLLCGEASPSPCPVRIRTRLAMAMSSPTSAAGPPRDALARAQAEGGGYYGRLGDLSFALVEEVVSWLLERQPGERLVLNLSLGWDADDLDAGGDQTRVGQMSGPAQAVYWSLQLARQSGALVVAASGNRRAGGASACQPPLLPAAWEVKPPAIGGPLGDWFRRCFTRWLRVPVRAAGAVQSEGFPLPNARPCSLPARAAYGDHVVVETRSGERTAVLTGTSAGAAVISASAAAVWTVWPKLSADQVIDLLYRSGDRLDFTANLYEGGGPRPTTQAPQVRRVSLCQAVARALEERPGGWGGAPRFACRDWERQLPTTLALVLPGEVVSSAGTGGQEDLAYCSSCTGPNTRSDGSSPLTRPQPEEDPCTTCTLTGGGGHTRPAVLLAAATTEPSRLVVEVKSGWKPAGWADSCPTLERLELEIERFDADGTGLVVDRRALDVTVPPLPPCLWSLAPPVSVELDWPSLDRSTARLRFHLRNEDTGERVQVESPVLVEREAPAETDLTTSLDN